MAMSREPDTEVHDVSECARMWREACGALSVSLAAADDAWTQLVQASPPDNIWHSLTNCTAYQAGIWQNLLNKGIPDVMQPAAFKLAVVLRHAPTDLTVRLLADLLHSHPHCQDLTSYILALVTEDEASCGGAQSPTSPGGMIGPAPPRDLQLFGDCELAVLAAPPARYDQHARRVRHEYTNLSYTHYIELRVKILNQFSKIPKLYHTPEFESFEATARENIRREIETLQEHLRTGVGDAPESPDC